MEAIDDGSLRALERSVIRIDHSSDPIDFRAGWFISSDGYILSAGHDLSREKEGEKFAVSLLSGEWKGEAVLLELGSELDYAIFKVEAGLPAIAGIIPVLRKQFENLRGVICVGPLAAIKGRSVTITGDLNISHPGHSGNTWLQFSTSDLNRKGMSGAPIVRRPPPVKWGGGVKNPVQAWEAVAIQTRQAKQKTSRTLAFGQPIWEVERVSALFSKIITEQDSRESFKRWPISVIEGSFWGTPAEHQPSERVVFVIREWGNSSDSEAIWNTLQDDLIGAKEDLVQEIESLSWLHQETEIPTHDLIDGKVRPTEPLHIHLDDRTQIAEEKVPLVRMTVDLTAKVNGMTLDPIQRDGISHSIAVVYPCSKDEWKVPPPLGSGVDALLHLKERTREGCADALHTIAHDVLLDVAIFHGIRVLPAFFSGPEGSRAFSEAKVRFIEKQNLKPYGMLFPASSSHYQSLAACSRTSLESPISQFNLTRYWHQFVSEYLLPSVARDDSGNTVSTSPDAVVEKLAESVPKLSFSKEKAQRRIKLLQASSGELCVLAVITKLPRVTAEKVRKALGELFHSGRTHKGLVGAFRFDSLRTLFAYRTYISIVIFRAS